MTPNTDPVRPAPSTARTYGHRPPPGRLDSVADDPKYHLDDPDVAAFTFCGLPTVGRSTGIVAGELVHGRLRLAIVDPVNGKERRSCRGCLAGWVRWAVKAHRLAVRHGQAH